MRRCFPKAVIFSAFLFLLAGLTGASGKAAALEDEVTVGVNVPLTGPYSDQGKDQEKAYKLAADKINSEGGLLGKKISLVIRDTKTNALTAKKNALEMIREHGAAMITGGSSSAVALAQSDVCQANGVVFMAALTHSNATTGHMHRDKWSSVQKAHRHTFRWYFNAWMTSEALTPFMIENFGKNAGYFYITADYTWGHTLEESMRRGTELAGAETAGMEATPLGLKNYGAQLSKAANSGADVLVLVLFGQDMVHALRQASDMGLKQKMRIVVPLMELHMARGAGQKAIEGVISTKNWYWGLKDKYPGSKEFVDAFSETYKKMPGSSAAAAWVAMHQWADAVRRAGDFSSGAVVRALEGHEFVLLKDEEQWRSWDHQAVSSVYVVRGKSAAESKGPWDLLEIIGEFKGADVMRNREENPVTLEKLPSERF